MSGRIKVLPNHPLIGTWISADESTSAEYKIELSGESFVVSGRDQETKEEFIISDVSWDGSKLRFHTLMRSTKHAARHAVRIGRDPDLMEHELTLVELWKRKPIAR
jgi:hypothetical protein